MKDLTVELETGGWSTVTSLGRLWYKGNESGDTIQLLQCYFEPKPWLTRKIGEGRADG
jgi:hypothetical protein